MYSAPSEQDGQSGRYMWGFVWSRGEGVHYSQELSPEVFRSDMAAETQGLLEGLLNSQYEVGRPSCL